MVMVGQFPSPKRYRQTTFRRRSEKHEIIMLRKWILMNPRVTEIILEIATFHKFVLPVTEGTHLQALNTNESNIVVATIAGRAQGHLTGAAVTDPRPAIAISHSLIVSWTALTTLPDHRLTRYPVMQRDRCIHLRTANI
jgi:hypothetical protein